MSCLLSILVPTVIGREKEFSILRQMVEEQSSRLLVRDYNGIEFLHAIDNKETSIGQKREWLYQKASGLYSWQIDDDDAIDEKSIYEICKAIFDKPDCITFRERCIINGQYFSSNHSLKYKDWGEHKDGYDYVRTPFMKSVIKTEIARSVPIPHIRFGEDHEWAKALKPHLRNEVHIDKELYIYQHNSKPEDHNSRYGIIE